jgi:hypothetical protein
VLTLTARPAGAEPSGESLERVQALVDSADFDGAEKEAERALDSGTLSWSALAHVYLELGVVASARNDLAAAEVSFRKALALDRGLALRESAGPHIAEVFGRVRKAVLAKPSMSIQLTLARGGDASEVVVTAKVTDDAEGLARAVVIEAQGVRALRPLDPSGASFVERVEQGAERCVTVTADIGDEHGNSVWPNAVRETFCPTAAVNVTPAAPPVAGRGPRSPRLDAPPAVRERPTPTHVWIGVGLTGALAVATTVLGVVALHERAKYHEKNADLGASVSERYQLESDAQAAERLATVAGVATGVVGATTLVLYLTRPTSEARARAASSAGQIAVFAEF